MFKTALITGTTNGLGSFLAKYFLKRNWKVIGISKSKGNIRNERYFHIKADLSSYSEIVNAFAEIKDKQIDLLIHNAAIFMIQSFDKTEDQKINDIIDINLKSPMYITKFSLSNMKEGSKIIFINSVAGLEEIENQSIYCASKSGLTSFAGILGKELSKRKIKVSSIHPGGINTTLWGEENPYPCGDVNNAISPNDICDIVGFIVDSPENLVHKTIKIFPEIEWH